MENDEKIIQIINAQLPESKKLEILGLSNHGIVYELLGPDEDLDKPAYSWSLLIK